MQTSETLGGNQATGCGVLKNEEKLLQQGKDD